MVSLWDIFANTTIRTQISAMLDAPRGIVAINGGDGSGKTNTLFGLAEEMRSRGTTCTVILKDPGLKTYLQDGSALKGWDIRMIGAGDDELCAELESAAARGVVIVEELDYRNAQLLVDVASTGGRIFTQIHTPFVGADCAYTLQKMGISSADFLATFSCIASQMLVPRLCIHCRMQVTIDAQEARSIDPTATGPLVVWKEVGCAQCEQRGTLGRLALHEVLIIDNASRPVLAKYLEKGELGNPLPEGHVTIQQTARELVQRGEVGLATYRHEIAENPILRMQHQWELERQRAGHIREMFSRFVTVQVVDRMLTDAHVQAVIDGERRWVTCMFADIRGFTKLAEGMPADGLFRLLNLYFKEIIQVVSEHGGTIDKFVGDCVMVLFGAPIDQPDHEYLAVRCAMAVQRSISRLNGQRADQQGIRMGIGINSGEAMTGCLGSTQRMDYTALGDTINTAARLEGKAEPSQILIGPETAKALAGRIQCRPVGSLTLKGKLAGVEAFEVIQA